MRNSKTMIYSAINSLIKYGLKTGLITEDDEIYTRNLLLEILKLDAYEEPDTGTESRLGVILDEILDYAYEKGIIDDNGITARDLFDTKIMNCLIMRPSEVIRTFNDLYRESPVKATDWYYKFSCDTNYIRRDRIEKDIKWKTPTEYGEMDITINLSKPEKDPKAIAAAGKAKSSTYPLCQLCRENEGYAGRADHPARENHRVIPVNIGGYDFYLQYSPYVYYNEHCIVFNKEHVPMKIDREAFKKLFGFIGKFPHYVIGSNADLPIVGGSILSHDHFQGGNYEFPMTRAKDDRTFTVKGYEDLSLSTLFWPMSVIRAKGKDPERLIEFADHTLKKWRAYTDREAFIYAETDGVPHNTVTPIVRKRDGLFEIDLTLRNNITTEECPLGVYHPHNELHHIKKENIGLIEVMGLAILPARLKTEINALKETILSGGSLRDSDLTEKHADWAEGFIKKRGNINEGNIDDILKEEIGLVFKRVLEDAGVFKLTDVGRAAFRRFTDTL